MQWLMDARGYGPELSAEALPAVAMLRSEPASEVLFAPEADFESLQLSALHAQRLRSSRNEGRLICALTILVAVLFVVLRPAL